MNQSNIKNSFIWSTVNVGGSQILGFIFGIILARILAPEDFGAIAIITFIILISHAIVDFGISQSFIRDQNISKSDYSSLFYFSLFIGLTCTCLIYSFSTIIDIYYNNYNLVTLIKVMSISPTIFSLMIVNNTIIIKKLDFKLKSNVTLTAIFISGFISIIMAINGYGIWSLVMLQLLNPFLTMIFLWFRVQWRPEIQFSFKFLIKHINFGSKNVISMILNIFYTKSFIVLLGKYFTLSDAGFYTRADNIKNIPNSMIVKIITRVSFPVLSKYQDDAKSLKEKNLLIIKSTAILSIPVMIGLASISEHLIVFLIGEKWIPSSEILIYLCFAGILVPFDSLNMNTLKVYGKMNTFLLLELIKFLLIMPVLFIGFNYGLKPMLFSIILHSIISFTLSSIISGKITNYKILNYLSDLFQPIAFSILMFVIVTSIQNYFMFSYFFELILSILLGSVTIIFLYEIFKNKYYLNLKKSILLKYFD